eukprot:CAMPEP_0113851194 /NCGR_PEP_ID=MMETSP0372-20130328/4439_1 /TAXON_ID=340204 /ORGANISM="Lankesteria abbotti" /LENGTH=159 /DNA_ID=CAMNT_0000821845 /DNA_START=92 /DNA_END=568 /DNA_ORIENTATION=- /assembly_acc=CAM_ASM_000359
MIIFVTVGTTSFDRLLDVVDSVPFHELAVSLGFHKLVVQMAGLHTIGESPLQIVESFELKPSIQQEVDGCDVVICHAGAGSVLQCLKAKKKCLAVVNGDLMGNHQIELALQLEEENYLLAAKSPSEVPSKFKKLCSSNLKEFPKPDSSNFWSMIDDEVV